MGPAASEEVLGLGGRGVAEPLDRQQLLLEHVPQGVLEQPMFCLCCVVVDRRV